MYDYKIQSRRTKTLKIVEIISQADSRLLVGKSFIECIETNSVLYAKNAQETSNCVNTTTCTSLNCFENCLCTSFSYHNPALKPSNPLGSF